MFFGFGGGSRDHPVAAAFYNALQNARTNREIRNLYHSVAAANFESRGVGVMKGTNPRQLLLTSGEDSDNDITCFKPVSQTPALDFIWGGTDDVGCTIVSGGREEDRNTALLPFMRKVQNANIPIFAIHAGNAALARMIGQYSTVYESVSMQDAYYDVFRGMAPEDISYLLYETMASGNAPAAAEFLLKAVVQTIMAQSGDVTIASLAAFHIPNLKNEIDTLLAQGLISNSEYADIWADFSAGSAERLAVGQFLNRLNRQFQTVYGQPGNQRANLKRVLNQNGSVAIDVGRNNNELLVNLVMKHVLLLHANGNPCAVILDGLPLCRIPDVQELILGGPFAISSPDFISSLYGGPQRGEDLFPKITGPVASTILFRHDSGTSCQKWSAHIGTYKKIRIRAAIGRNRAFLHEGNTHGYSVDEADEPKISADTINKLPDGMACLCRSDGILIAAVTAPSP